MKKTITWILVADGARARVLKNEGPGKGLQPALNQDFIGENLSSAELVSDRPGRTFDGSGDGRHAKVPHSDPHRNAKRVFAREMARFLERESAKHSFDRLVLVAPPQALGDLRAALSGSAKAKVSGEMNKDLTTLSVTEIAAHLGAVLAV
jgi:protein required for attachment to host cells